jgi:hypothetical protein
MVTIQQVKPASGGFGMFDLGEAVEQPEFETISDWLADAAGNGYTTDEGTQAAAADANGNIYGQGGGRVVGLRDERGAITLWCVYES